MAGEGLQGLLDNAIWAQISYDGVNCNDYSPPPPPPRPSGCKVHWITAVAPPAPRQRVEAGDGVVVIEWDNFPEYVGDPMDNNRQDFAGYQVWKAQGWDRGSVMPSDDMWTLVAQFNKRNGDLSRVDTGLAGIGKYRYVDDYVHNGLPYWYAVTSYDDTGLYGKYSQTQTLAWPRSMAYESVDRVQVYPNPYRPNGVADLRETQSDPSGSRIFFANLPSSATIRVYTLAGDLVHTIHHSSSHAGEEAHWNLVSRNNQRVVSGTYLYHIETPIGEKVGRFAVIW